MTDKAIEAAARAIYEARNGHGCKPWSILTKAHKEPYLKDATVGSAAYEAALWRPIEEAPELVEFLAYDSAAKKFDVATRSWDGVFAVQMDNEYGPSASEFGYRQETISHFRPLPDPPEPSP